MVLQGVQIAAAPVSAGSLVPQRHANVGDALASAANEALCRLYCSTIVVEIEAGNALLLLSQQHDGLLIRAHHRQMLLAHQRADEDHAIYVVHPKELEVLQLPLGVVSGVRQKHLIGRVAHCLGDAVHHPCHGLRTNLRNNDANEIVASGAQGLGGGAGRVAGPFNDLLNFLAFLLADIAMVQVAGNGCRRNTGKCCDCTDVHKNILLTSDTSSVFTKYIIF